MRRMGTLVAIAGFALAATLTGCGGEEPTAQETSTASSTPSESPSPSPTESESSTPATPEIGDNVPAEYKEFCTKLAGFSGDILSGMSSKPDQSFADKYQDLADVAPPATKEDWQLLADIVQLSVDVQKDPANADTEKLTELTGKLNAATTRITEDAKKCAGT